MDIFEMSHELGKMIEGSEEMAVLREKDKAQSEDEDAQTLLQEFQLESMNLSRDIQNEKITREEGQLRYNNAYKKLLEESESIREYMQAKTAFDAMVNKINGILNFYITGQEPGCTHDCGSCGGCG